MKVLHLPVNWASRMYHQHQALQRSGVDSRGLAFHCFPSQRPDGLYVHSERFRKIYGKPFTHKLMRTMFLAKIINEAKKCDYIHWYGGERLLSLPFDLKLMRSLGNKKCFVQWQGSDIRDPIMESDLNPYYRKATEHVSVKEKERISKNCKEKQKLFNDFGFQSFVPVDLESYLIDSVRQEGWYSIRHAIDCDSLEPITKKEERIFMIGHSPTKKHIKGTQGIEHVVKVLRRDYPIELKVLHGLTREESLRQVATCDLFVDQLVLGMYGASSLEAMSLGIPTICYISSRNKRRLPVELPIVDATFDSLADVIRDLLNNRDLLISKRIDSRKYVIRYHSYSSIANLIVSAYLGKRGREFVS